MQTPMDHDPGLEQPIRNETVCSTGSIYSIFRVHKWLYNISPYTLYTVYTGFQLATGQGQGLALGALKLQHDPQGRCSNKQGMLQYPPFHLLVFHSKLPSLSVQIVQCGMRGGTHI